MNASSKRLFAGAVLQLMVAGAAHAQTQVTARNQVPASQTVDWSQVGGNWSVPTNPFVVALGFADMTVSSDAAFFWRLDAGDPWVGGFADGQHLLHARFGTLMNFSFSSAVTGFATQLWNNFPVAGGSFFLSAFRDGSLIAQYSAQADGGPAANTGQAPLLGVFDEQGFDLITLRSVGDGQREFAINDLTLSSGKASAAYATPEPASLGLLATGLIVVGIGYRRRRLANSST